MLNLDFFLIILEDTQQMNWTTKIHKKNTEEKKLKKYNYLGLGVGEGVGMVQNSKNNSSGTLIRG